MLETIGKSSNKHAGWTFGVIALLTFFLVSTIVTMACLTRVGAVPSRDFEAPEPEDKDSMVVSLVMLEEDIAGLNEKAAYLEDNSRKIDAEIEAFDDEISVKNEKLNDKREILNKRIRSLYMNGKGSGLNSLLESEDVTDFLTRLEHLKIVADYDTELINDIRIEVAEIEEKKAALEAKQVENDMVLAELQQKRSRLTEQLEEKRQLIAQAKESSEEVQSRADSVVSKIDEIQPESPPPGNSSGRTMEVLATAYCPLEPGLGPGTATGIPARKGVIAVDPRVIPLGSRLYVHGYGYGIAADTGSAIKGNKIDLCFDTLEEMNGWRTRKVKVEILD